MKRWFLLISLSLFFIASFESCVGGECPGSSLIQFEYRSLADSSDLIKSGQFLVSDIHWQFLLNDPNGAKPDTLFLNDQGISVLLWVTVNPNLRGIITQLSSFKPDTVFITSHPEDTPFCPPATMVDSLKLNGQNINPVQTIQLFK